MTCTPSPDSSTLDPRAPARRDQHGSDLRFLETLQATLAGCRNVQDIYGSAVHRVSAAYGADATCLAAGDPITGRFDLVHQNRSDRARELAYAWDIELFRQVMAEEHTVVRGEVLAVPVIGESVPSSDGRVGPEKRIWGVLAVVRLTGADEAPLYTRSERQTLRVAGERIGSELERRRIHLIDDVLDGLLRKTKPIDVYTHTLRELRRFIRYDQGASIMTMQRGLAQLTVRVEKVVLARGEKETLVDSPRRGRALRLTATQNAYLTRLNRPIELVNEGAGWKLAGHADPDAAGLWRVLCPENGSETGSVLCCPLTFGGHMLGILRLAARRAHAFEPLTLYAGLLDRFARLLSVTLYRSEMYHQSDRQLQAVKEIGRVITEPIPVEEVCRQVLQIALRVLHVQVGVVGLLTEDGTIELVAHQGCTLPEPPTLTVGEGISGTVIHSGKSWAVPDVKCEPAYVIFNNRVCSELVAPIIYDREVIGFIDVESFEEGRFREEDEEVITFLEALANQAAIAIKTAQLRSETMERLGASLVIDPTLSMAGLQDLLVEELRTKIDELAGANERLEAANRAKSEFLAHMSHDLRGPLNVIVGLSNLLADPEVAATLDEEKRRESLELIRANGEVLGSLIGNILNLSALEAGKTELTIAPFDPQAAFKYLAAVARTLVTESHKELGIVVTVDPAITSITADEEKFLRIMHNLISNAVKCTPSGGRISVEAAIDDDRALHLTVSDTGVGIAPEDQERIFQPFQQIDNAVSRHLHGTGLGLAVVQQLVRLHAGRAWVESTPGEGSAFHVVLPEALPPVAELEEIIPVDGAVSPRGGSNGQDILFRDRRSRLSVLAVEDTPAHLSMMRLAVTSRGYTMHGVGSGEEALAWLAQPDNRPDVILLDMQLPGLDGFEVAARVKEQVETHAIPVIAVTADALSVNEERALASGCDAYLTKPIDIAKLLATIETVTA